MLRIPRVVRVTALGLAMVGAVLLTGCGDSKKADPKVKGPEGSSGELQPRPEPVAPGGGKQKPGSTSGVQ
jgi:hypothetical protein